MMYNGFFGYSIMIDVVLILILFLLIFVNVITFICVLIRKKFGKRFYIYTGVNLFVSLIIFILTLPTILSLGAAVYYNDYKTPIKYLNFAAKIATKKEFKADAYHNIADMYKYSKDYKKAIMYCEKSLSYAEKEDKFSELPPYTFTCSPFELQELYLKSQEYDKAIITIEKYSDYFDENYKSFKFYLLTKAYCLSNDYQNALKSINSYIGADKKNSAGTDYAIRGYIYTKLNQTALAQQDFNKAQEEMNKWCKKVNCNEPDKKQKRLESYMKGEFLKEYVSP